QSSRTRSGRSFERSASWTATTRGAHCTTTWIGRTSRSGGSASVGSTRRSSSTSGDMPPRPDDLEGFRVPDGFSFGVATSGYQIEGGFNGPGEPRNNWFEWERRKGVEPCGPACDSWNRYEEDLELAASI